PMTKTNKRNLIIVAVVLSVALIAAVCVSVFFPKKTIADLLYLTSKDQIKQITISSVHRTNVTVVDPVGETVYNKQLDISDTPLGKQYVDALFSKPVVLQESGICTPSRRDVQGTDYKVVTVDLTIDGGDDFPIRQTSIPIKCCAYPQRCSNFHEVMIAYDYTPEYLRAQFEKGEYGKDSNQIYFFTIPGDELFTSAFINEQLGVGD
ncbi:hypothetical protein H6A12_12935, partial [Phocea massiliensis]